MLWGSKTFVDYRERARYGEGSFPLGQGKVWSEEIIWSLLALMGWGAMVASCDVRCSCQGASVDVLGNMIFSQKAGFL